MVRRQQLQWWWRPGLWYCVYITDHIYHMIYYGPQQTNTRMNIYCNPLQNSRNWNHQIHTMQLGTDRYGTVLHTLPIQLCFPVHPWLSLCIPICFLAVSPFPRFHWSGSLHASAFVLHCNIVSTQITATLVVASKLPSVRLWV